MAAGLVAKPVQSQITPGGAISKDSLTTQQQLVNKLMAAGVRPPSSAPSNPYQQQIQQILEANEAKYKRDPIFIDDTPILTVPGVSFPSSLVVTVSNAYLWGTNDLSSIERTLGYDSVTVPRQCQIRMDISVTTADDPIGNQANILAGSRDYIGYKGNIQSVSLRPRAICNQPRVLPRNGGIITRVGDKFAVLLGSGSNCVPAADRQAPSTLEIQYAGDGKFACKFN